MPGFYQSVGCFPGNTAISSVSQDDLRRLTYGTSYKAGVPGKVMRAEDKWENMIDIHNLGKKDTKYMKFQKNTAPLLDRSALCSTRDFVELPLGDNLINGELAQNFKKGLKGFAAGSEVEQKAESMYKMEFAAYPEDRSKAAKPKSCKPKQNRTKTITGMTELMETRPVSHVAHSAPNAALAKAAETVLAKPNITLGATWGKPPNTSYKHEFRGLKPSASAPHIGAASSEASSLLPRDHESFRMRRCCYMAPGQ